MTPNIGEYPISHWTYLATLLSRALAKCRETGRITIPEHHTSLLMDARDFFEPIKDYGSGKDHVPNNPPAAVHAVSLYCGSVMDEILECRKLTWEERCHKLLEIGNFVSTFDQPRQLAPEEIKTAELAHAFFVKVRELGNSESYTRVVGDTNYTYS